MLPVEARLALEAVVALTALLEGSVPEEEPELPGTPGSVEGGDAAGVTAAVAKRPFPFAFDAVTLTE